MRATATRTWTAVIGAELARLIRDGQDAITFRVCQFGGLERIASTPAWSEQLPAVYVDPQESVYVGEDVSGLNYEVTDRFRIVHFFGYSNRDDLGEIACRRIGLILEQLAADATLSNIANVLFDQKEGTHDQVSISQCDGVEWHPDEQAFLVDAQLAIKCVAVRWQVKWLNRI